MFTSIDKALVALIMGLLYMFQTFTGIGTSFLSEGTITTIVSLLTPLLVYLVPNKKPAA